MNSTRFTRSIFLITAAAQLSFGAPFHVAQDGSAGYTSIQAAVNAASPGDEIIIDDNATYKEQVTIDSTKNNLILRSATPASSNKPHIIGVIP